VGEGKDDAAHVRLDQVVEEADPLAVAGVDLGGAVGHLDQQRAVTAQQQRKGGMRGDEMGVHPHPQHPQATGEVVLPHRRVTLGVAVAAEDVVDQDVQAAVLGLGDQAGHGRGVLVVNDQGCAAPTAAIRSPVSSIVSGHPISDLPAAGLLRPVA
jgi:hypothetical protein